MTSYSYLLLKTTVIIVLVDLFWLLTGGIYARKMTENIQGSPVQIRWIALPVVYLFLAYMLLQTTSNKQAFMYGVSIYAVYDFTNYATLTRYPLKFAIQDTLWGATLMAIAFKVGQAVF
jgi:uncharacterized membrane protein